VKSEAFDIQELADQLQIGSKFYVIGISMGAYPIWGCLKYIPHRHDPYFNYHHSFLSPFFFFDVLIGCFPCGTETLFAGCQELPLLFLLCTTGGLFFLPIYQERNLESCLYRTNGHFRLHITLLGYSIGG
jgi:hypothetical protein